MEHHPSIVAELSIEVRDGGAFAVVTFANCGGRVAALNRITAGLSGNLEASVFIIEGEGGDVRPYTGPLIRRKGFPSRDFLRLSPGAKVVAMVRLDAYYEFPPVASTSSVRYRAIHEEPGRRGHFWDVESNTVTFTFDPQVR